MATANDLYKGSTHHMNDAVAGATVANKKNSVGAISKKKATGYFGPTINDAAAKGMAAVAAIAKAFTARSVERLSSWSTSARNRSTHQPPNQMPNTPDRRKGRGESEKERKTDGQRE